MKYLDIWLNNILKNGFLFMRHKYMLKKLQLQGFILCFTAGFFVLLKKSG